MVVTIRITSFLVSIVIFLNYYNPSYNYLWNQSYYNMSYHYYNHMSYLYFRYIATGKSFSSLAFQFRIGKTSVQRIIKDTSNAAWEVLQPHYMPVPDHHQWKETARIFFGKMQCSKLHRKCGRQALSDEMPTECRLALP